MFFGLALVVLGLALVAFGHRTLRLQVRAIGAGLVAFGVVTAVLSGIG